MNVNSDYTYMIPKYHLRPYINMDEEKLFHKHLLDWNTGVEVFVEDLHEYMARARYE